MLTLAGFAERSNQTELMNGSDYTEAELIENLAGLRRVNRCLGGRALLTLHLFPMIEAAVISKIRRPPLCSRASPVSPAWCLSSTICC